MSNYKSDISLDNKELTHLILYTG